MAKFIDKQGRNASNSFVATQLLEYLKDKYEQKMWRVMVFDPAHGQISDDFHMVLDRNGRSAVATSYPKDSVNTKVSEDARMKMLNFTATDGKVEKIYNDFLKHVRPEPVKIIVLEGKHDALSRYDWGNPRIDMFYQNYKYCTWIVYCTYYTVYVVSAYNVTTMF